MISASGGAPSAVARRSYFAHQEPGFTVVGGRTGMQNAGFGPRGRAETDARHLAPHQADRALLGRAPFHQRCGRAIVALLALRLLGKPDQRVVLLEADRRTPGVSTAAQMRASWSA